MYMYLHKYMILLQYNISIHTNTYTACASKLHSRLMRFEVRRDQQRNSRGSRKGKTLLRLLEYILYGVHEAIRYR